MTSSTPARDLVRSRVRRLCVALVAATSVVTATLAGSTGTASALTANCVQPVAAGLVTCTFSYTGEAASFVVPDGVTRVAVTAYGGHGGSPSQGATASAGGAGGIATGWFTVTPRQRLTLYVAGDSQGSRGGFGYGRGGSSDHVEWGGGGGGSSAVLWPNGTPVVVAGGGGGGGIRSGCAVAGDGGDAGADGSPGASCFISPRGVGGASGTEPGPDGGDGYRGSYWSGGGGGGGGGYRGGAGGQGPNLLIPSNPSGGGGGGGGSSYVAPSGSNLTMAGLSDRPLGANGLVTIAYQPVGALVGLNMSPETATIELGDSQAYTVIGPNYELATVDVTASADLDIEPDGSCVGAVCTPASGGPHLVVARIKPGAIDELVTTAELIVNAVPTLTSPSEATFRIGEAGSFEIAADGYPQPEFSLYSSLPPGLEFVDNGDGTASIFGTPSGPAATTRVAIGATNVVDTTIAMLELTVTEGEPPPTPIACMGLEATITGTSADDVLEGTAGEDVIVGLGGDDQISGLGGDDVICSGAGDDAVSGGGGADSIVSGTGSDRVSGGAGVDVVAAGGGGDRVAGGGGGDTLAVGGGADVAKGGAGSDVVRGGIGDDWLYGDGQPDRVFGQAGRDHLYGGPAADYLRGGSGVDVCPDADATDDSP